MSERDCSVSKRTIYRDLEALNDAGFPLFPQEDSNDEGATRWVLERGTRIGQYLALTSEELFALHLAKGLLPPSLESVFRKIEDKLGSVHREHFAELANEVHLDPGPDWSAGVDAETLATVRAACAEEQVLSADYQSVSSGKTSRRRLGPHYLYFAKGSVYLIAEDLDAAETKVFALSRMSNAVMEDLSYKGKPVNHDEFFASAFGVFRGAHPTEVTIEFSKNVASYVCERKWHTTQRVTRLEDKSARLSMTVAITPELIQWVLGFGADARVVAPDELRERLRVTIAQMASEYSGTPLLISTPFK